MSERITDLDRRAWRLFGGHLAEPADPDAVEALQQLVTAIGRAEPVTPDMLRAARLALQEASVRAAERRRTTPHLRVVRP